VPPGATQVIYKDKDLFESSQKNNSVFKVVFFAYTTKDDNNKTKINIYNFKPFIYNFIGILNALTKVLSK